MKRALFIVSVFVLGAGCAHAPPPADKLPPAPRETRHERASLAVVEVVYHGDMAYARLGTEEWPIAEVPKSQLSFSPDGQRFAYAKPPRSTAEKSPHRMVVRNIAGEPVNEFSLYRAGKPESVTWLDDRRVGYVAPAVPEQRLPAVYVVHDVQSGEVLRARSGSAFVWGPERHHVAFIAGAGDKQNLIVDGKSVWPRRGVTKLPGMPVWSPDGHGLAFVDSGTGGTVSAATHLVVLVEYDDPEGDLTWPVPKDAVAPGLRVFWAGDSKVIIGETALRPRFAAGWERVR